MHDAAMSEPPLPRSGHERYSAFYRRLFVVATGIILGYVLWRMLEPLLGSLEWAAVLAFVLYPLQARLCRRLRGRASLAAGTLTLLTPFLVIAPVLVLGLAFASQVGDLVHYLRSRSRGPLPDSLASLEHYPAIARFLDWLHHTSGIDVQQVEQWLTDGARTVLQTAASMSGNVMVGVAGTLVGFFLMLFLLFFMLRDGHATLTHLFRLIPLREGRRTRLVRGISDALRAVIFGTAATAAIEGALMGIGFAIAGLPSPVVFGVLSAFAALLPVVGITIVFVPATLYLLFEKHWGFAIFLGLWGVGVIIAEHLLRPYITSRHGEVSSLAAFIGAIGGIAAFGFIGLVIGPVILTLIVALLRIGEEMVSRPD